MRNRMDFGALIVRFWEPYSHYRILEGVILAGVDNHNPVGCILCLTRRAMFVRLKGLNA